MKNLRTIKKDVEFLVDEIIDDCFIYLELNDNKNADKIGEIIGAALDLEEKLVDKINHRPKEVKAKAYYKGIEDELNQGIDKLYEELSGLNK